MYELFPTGNAKIKEIFPNFNVKFIYTTSFVNVFQCTVYIITHIRHYIISQIPKRLHYFLSDKYIGNNFRHIFGHKDYYMI